MKGISLLLGIAVFLFAGTASYAGENSEARSNVSGGTAIQSGGSTGTLDLAYPLVDTNQGLFYDSSEQIDPPAEGEPFYGQDAHYTGSVPSYTDNGDGTITDNVTGLVWTQEVSDYSMVWSDAEEYAESLTTGGITDWRVPEPYVLTLSTKRGLTARTASDTTTMSALYVAAG
jgi:uncharacterized protein DUF1566